MNKQKFGLSINLLLMILIVGILLFISCTKKDVWNTDPNFKLQFSTDSVIFDTVFTTIGSITKSLKIYNKTSKKIQISSIRLVGGLNSQYQINIDGSSDLIQENIELDGNDSLFIFVRVIIDPNDENIPFVVEDQIEFLTNGNLQNVSLFSWGQNANYIIGDQVSEDGIYYKVIAANGSDITWDSPKPYVVYGFAKIDTNAILRLPEGCRIFFHKNSGIWVTQNGCLKISGTLKNPVKLKGDRLDEGYRDLPGYWDGIIIEESNQTTEFNYAVIENATNGIVAKTITEIKANQITIFNTIIRNMTETGISSQAFSIESNNTLIANCGKSILNIQQGGNLNFNHSTFANYWKRSFRINPSIKLSTVINTDDQTLYNDLNASFGNCIIHGIQQNEIEFDSHSEANLNVVFNHCSLKTTEDITINPSRYISCIINPNVVFADIESNEFKLNAESQLINAGLISIGQIVPYDLIGNSRLPFPDIGAIEYIPD